MSLIAQFDSDQKKQRNERFTKGNWKEIQVQRGSF
jgi:hypothetical protein